MNLKTRILLLINLTFLLVSAQNDLALSDTMELTITDAINIATRNNINLKKTRLNTAILNKQIQSARSIAMPQINGSAGYTDNFQLPEVIIPGEFFGQTGNIPVTFGVRYQLNATVEASQMIFDMAYFKNLKKLDAARATNDLKTLATIEDLVYNVIQVYIQSKIVNEQKEILNSNLNRINQLIQMAEAQYANGIIKKLDVDQLLVNKTNILTEITNLNISEEQLLLAIKYYLDLDFDQAIKLTENLTENNVFTYTEELMLEKNINYQLLGKQKEIAVKENKVITAGYYPKISAFAQYGYTGQADEFNFKSDNYSNYNSGLWGISLSMPIFDGLQKVRNLQENKLKIQQIELDQENFEASTTMAYRNAKTKITLNNEQVFAQNKNMELANEVYQITQLSYQEGIAPLTELLDAETSLKQAQTNYLTALLNLKLAELDFVKTSGQLTQLIK